MKKIPWKATLALLICVCIGGCSEEGEFIMPGSLTEDTETAREGGSEALSREDPEPASEDNEEEQSKGSGSEITTIQVFVCGEVTEPGVYSLPCDARIYQAIEAAGGMTGEAAINALNQAASLSDGEKIYVPAEGEEIRAEETGESDDGLVNINTADKKTLMTLPGIGESKAAAILEYRENNGNFSDINQLKNIAGIKDRVFSEIEDLVKV